MGVRGGLDLLGYLDAVYLGTKILFYIIYIMRSWLVLGAVVTILGGYVGLYLLFSHGLGRQFTQNTSK